MTSPRVEIDLGVIGRNAQQVVGWASEHGVSITGITKALRGHPDLGRVLLGAGVTALGDSRIDNIERLRAGGVRASVTLIRSPLASEVERVVAAADLSCNTELEMVALLSAAAVRAHRRHGVLLMVELGDLREGIMPCELHDTVMRCLALPNIDVRGIGTNLACRSGVVPDDRNMGELSDLAESIEARFDLTLDVVSGGNSANLGWLRSTKQVGRIDNLRLGESILLGRDPVDGTPIPGLRHDAVTVFAEVIESKDKPRQAWGQQARTPFVAAPAPAPIDGCHGWHSLLAIGHQDTDPFDLVAPPQIRIVGASSDHLVVASEHRLPLGSELAFRPGYSALVRATSSRYVHPVFRAA